MVFESTFSSCVPGLDKTPCISKKQPLPPDQHSGSKSASKTGLEKVARVKFLVVWQLLAHSQAASQLLHKTPCISEKRPLPPDQHPDSNSTPKTGLTKVGLVKSLLGWQILSECLEFSVIKRAIEIKHECKCQKVKSA